MVILLLDTNGVLAPNLMSVPGGGDESLAVNSELGGGYCINFLLW